MCGFLYSERTENSNFVPCQPSATKIKQHYFKNRVPKKLDTLITNNNQSKTMQYFNITSVHREDLESRGYDIRNISDATMERLADKMANEYLGGSFWIDLEIIADYLEIPKK